MFGISLGLFSPSHTTEQKLLHFFVRLPFSPSSSCFLFFQLFFFFITLSQPSVFLQQSNTHDNLIVCRCSFNTKPWWGALQSGKAEGISVCVRAPFFHHHGSSTVVFMITRPAVFLLLSAAYDGDVSFPSAEREALTHHRAVSTQVDWPVPSPQGLCRSVHF